MVNEEWIAEKLEEIVEGMSETGRSGFTDSKLFYWGDFSELFEDMIAALKRGVQYGQFKKHRYGGNILYGELPRRF